MGLDWSEPFRLRERLDVSPPATGLYRIWRDGSPLTYIGESSDLPDRLYSHDKEYGSDALVSYADRPDLNAQHKRLEIETELIGLLGA
jgi:excinuclease UvrABC nuclease subunit